jgi:hypothetical protein
MDGNLLVVLGSLLMTAARCGTTIPAEERAPEEGKPDPRQARPLERWPNQEDLNRLRSVIGRSPAGTVHILGHPSRIELLADGAEVWHYPWSASCRVFFRRGVVVDIDYTAGF